MTLINHFNLNIDVNECTDTHLMNGGCQQKCVNLPGSYKCACGNGYQLKNDSLTCQGETF